MPHSPNPITTLLFATSVVLAGIPTSAIAQITANPNDAGTIVNQNGNIINIEGGTQTGANLFHSLDEFRVNQGQTANFISNPAIQNILGRVTGGEASVINGIIQVTGGNSNLYLMNPAGIIFGAGASLNVPAAFTATTANGIGFGDKWLNAVGTNNYASLVGNPTAFAFTQAGTIFNAGNLAVNAGQNLTLIGGTVVSTGTISAPGGNITIAAIPGEQLVSITPEGSLLSLALPVETKAAINPATLTPLTLPQLLTGANISGATGVTVENGVVKLTGADVNIESGDVVAKGVNAQTATLSADKNLTLVESQISTTGNLNLLARDTVRVRDSVANPVKIQAGGNLLIKGDTSIDILALNHPEAAFQSQGNLSLVSNGIISGDAHFFSGGKFSILNLAGNPGNFVSLYDPIISATGDVSFGSYTGASLKIETTGSIKVNGDITINTPDTTLPAGSPGSDREILRTSPSLILRAGLANLEETIKANSATNPPFTFIEPISGTAFNASTGSSPGSIDITGNIKTTPATGNAGQVILAATGGITVTGKIDTSAIDANSPAKGGDIRISTNTGDIQVGEIQASGSLFNAPAGSVKISSNSGNITTLGKIENVNNFDISTKGNITTSYISANGSINLNTTDGEIKLGNPNDSPILNDLKDLTRAIYAVETLSASAQGTIQAFTHLKGGNSVKLSSTGGNVIITTIVAGSGGVDINAAGLFQARGYFIDPAFNKIIKPGTTDAELTKFLLEKGIKFDDPAEIIQGYSTVPISILAIPSSTQPSGSLNAPITIGYGGATQTVVVQTFEISSDNTKNSTKTVGRILIKGGNGSYYTGPDVSGKLLPDVDDSYITNVDGNFVKVTPETFTAGGNYLSRNETYSTNFPSDKFPTDGNGTVGALVVGFSSNTNLYGSVQSRVFPSNPNKGTGTVTTVTDKGTVTVTTVTDKGTVTVTTVTDKGTGTGNGTVTTVTDKGTGTGNGTGTDTVTDKGNGTGTGAGTGNDTIPDSQQQIVQRQINPGTNSDACNTSNTIAVNPQRTNGTNRDSSSRIATSSPSGSNNGCTPANNDLEILKILYETPNFDQNKLLNFDSSHHKFSDMAVSSGSSDK